ncbi:Uncharacterised protein [Mycobacterium tuberculosis]|nr:Uncharacterised protein [Mycobacterium tuberculosis]
MATGAPSPVKALTARPAASPSPPSPTRTCTRSPVASDRVNAASVYSAARTIASPGSARPSPSSSPCAWAAASRTAWPGVRPATSISAKNSVSSRHARCSASVGTSTASIGGQACCAPAGRSSATEPGASVPETCRVHSPVSCSPSGRVCTASSRAPSGPGEPTVTWSWSAPCSGTTSGARTASARTTPQPLSSPARSTRSSSPESGSSATPAAAASADSASQGCAARERQPVSSTPPPASATDAPTSGCPVADRPTAPMSPTGSAGASSQ